MTSSKYAWRTCLKCLQADKDPTKKDTEGGALFYSEGPWNRLCEKHKLQAERSGINNPEMYPEMPEDVIIPVANAKDHNPPSGWISYKRNRRRRIKSHD